MGSFRHSGLCTQRNLKDDPKAKNISRQRTLKFINDEASSIHANVRLSSVFTSESGEWKLGGFDLLSSMKEDEAVIYVSRVNGMVVNACSKY